MKPPPRKPTADESWKETPLGIVPEIGRHFLLTPDLITEVKQRLDARILAEALRAEGERPHVRYLLDEMQTTLQIIEAIGTDEKATLALRASRLNAASFGLAFGVFNERLRVCQFEAHTASGAKSHAATKQKGRKASAKSVRGVLEKHFPGWRDKSPASLARKLQPHFDHRDLDELRTAIIAAKKVPH